MPSGQRRQKRATTTIRTFVTKSVTNKTATTLYHLPPPLRCGVVSVQRLVHPAFMDLGEGGVISADADDGFGFSFRRAASRRHLQPMHVLRTQLRKGRH